MKTKQQDDKRSPWEPTRYQSLFRYLSSGIIFARFKIGGKQVRQSLKTSNLELAKNKLAELERNERAVAEDRRRGKMLFREALEEHLESVRCDAALKPRTRDYYQLRLNFRLSFLDFRREYVNCRCGDIHAAERCAPKDNHTLPGHLSAATVGW